MLGSAGNIGLKEQIMTLKWVQENTTLEGTKIMFFELKSSNFGKDAVLRGFTDSEGFIEAGIKPHDIKEVTTFQNYADFWRYPLEWY